MCFNKETTFLIYSKGQLLHSMQSTTRYYYYPAHYCPNIALWSNICLTIFFSHKRPESLLLTTKIRDIMSRTSTKEKAING